MQKILIALFVLLSIATLDAQKIPVWQHTPSGVINSPAQSMQAYVGGAFSGAIVQGTSGGLKPGFLWAPGVPKTTDVDNKTNAVVRPVLSWTDSTGAYAYKVQISTASNFNAGALVVDDSLTYPTAGYVEPYTLSQDLAANTTYYWRVRGMHTGGQSAWSDTLSFVTVKNVISVPTKTSPLDSTVLASNVILGWTTVANATGYEYEVSTDQTFSDKSKVVATNVGAHATSNSVTFTATACVQYYWHVRAIVNADASSWSTPAWKFMYTPQLGAFSQQSPNNITTTTAPSFSWTSSSNAQSYLLIVTRVSDSKRDTVTIPAGSTNFDWPSNNALSDGENYTWRIVALGCAGTTIQQVSVPTDLAFLVGNPSTCKVNLTLNSPINGQTVSAVVLQWTPSTSGALNYGYMISTDPTFSGVSATNTTDASNSVIPTSTFENGKTYYWKARAQCSAASFGNWSNTESFVYAGSTQECLVASDLDFKDIVVSTSQLLPVSATNTVSNKHPRKILSAKASGDGSVFTLVATVDNSYIEYGSTKDVVLVRATPIQAMSYTDTLSIVSQDFVTSQLCTTKVLLKVNGVGASNLASHLRIKRTESTKGLIAPGDSAYVTIGLDSLSNSLNPGSFDSLLLSFYYDRRAFQLERLVNAGSQGEIGLDQYPSARNKVQLSIVHPKLDADRVMATLVFSAKLAETDTTILSFTNPVWMKSGIPTVIADQTVESYTIPLIVKTCVDGASKQLVKPAKSATLLTMLSSYPNPTSDELTIDLSSTEQTDCRIQIYDSFGREVVSASEQVIPAGRSTLNLNCRNFCTGSYTIVIQAGSEIYHNCVMIQR